MTVPGIGTPHEPTRRDALVDRTDRAGRRGLGEAVALDQRGAGQLLEALLHLDRQRRAARHADFQRLQVEPLRLGMLQDRGVERRHAGQEAGLLLRQVAHDLVDVGPRIEDELVAVAHRAQHDSRQRVDVEQRQHAHHFLGARCRVGRGPGLALAHRRDDAAVRQHGGLGQAGGAAGVLQQRHLVPQVLVRGIGRVLAVVGQEILERHVPVVARPDRDLLLLGDRIEPVLGPRQIVGDRAHDQFLEPGLAAHPRHLGIERGGIERHQDVGLGIADLELEFARGIERAVVHHLAAGLQHAEEGDDVVRRVGQVEPDIDAGLDAELLEARGRPVRRLLVVAEGHHLVEEVGEGLVAELRAALLEDLMDGLLGHIELPPHAGRIALLPRVVRHFLFLPRATIEGAREGVKAAGSAAPAARDIRRRRPCGSPARRRAASPPRWSPRPAGRRSGRRGSRPRHRGFR